MANVQDDKATVCKLFVYLNLKEGEWMTYCEFKTFFQDFYFNLTKVCVTNEDFTFGNLKFMMRNKK